MHSCLKCGQLWDDIRARDNELTCTRRCGGELLPTKPLAIADLEGCDICQLPYPVALTAHRLASALQTSGDVLKTLFLVKDCFEATIKYLGAVLLAEYRRSQAYTKEHTEVLLKAMVRPSLGAWVNDLARPLSLWLSGEHPPGGVAAALFAEPPARPAGKPTESALMQRCKEFVTYRNDALGHGAQRRDSVYESDLTQWLPLIRRLFDGVARLASWRLCLVTAEDRCKLWLGPQPNTATETGSFSTTEIAHFVLCGPGHYRDLHPFLCYLPDIEQTTRLHYYDSVYRYNATKKEAIVLEYDNGSRHPRPEPITGMENAYTAELLAKAFERHRGRMEIIEGRVANFGELIETHAAIVGRRFVIDQVHDFLAREDRGLLVIEAQPGKGKTALLAHMIEEEFGHYAPTPVHFFYRRTAGITDPHVCARSLYAALLQAHGITEAEESKQKNSPEEVFTKLTNMLSDEVAPRLLPGRPQLLFVDALDEAAGNAFQWIPENLPAGIYIIAATRPVSDRVVLARRQDLHWYDLDSPNLLQENLRDGFDYVQRELVGTELPHETLSEIARTGAGNFLVLKLLCQHLRTTLAPDQVAAFLRRLSTDGGKDQLGFIYAEFWDRLTTRCTRADINLLCDVAGVLVMARAPLSADMVCDVLGLRAGDWDFALRRLAEYLVARTYDEKGTEETFYRVYHESFADFLRAKVLTDQRRYADGLANYCLRWAQLPNSYGRGYALRFAAYHLLEAGRPEEAVALLLGWNFLEAKIAVELVFDLVEDFRVVVSRLSESRPTVAVELDRWYHFVRAQASVLRSHPQLFFQQALNEPRDSLVSRTAQTRIRTADSPERWLEWVNRPRESDPSACLQALMGHTSDVRAVATMPDSLTALSGSMDRTIRIWDLTSGRCRAVLRGHGDGITSLVVSPSGTLAVSGSLDTTFRVWDLASHQCLAAVAEHEKAVTCLAISPDGGALVSGSYDRSVRVWDIPSLRCRAILTGHEAGVLNVTFAIDGRSIVSASSDGMVRRWDLATSRCLAVRTQKPGVGVEAFALHGRTAVSGDVSGDVCVWDLDSGDIRWQMRGHSIGVRGMAITLDGRTLVTGAGQGELFTWDLHSGRLRGNLQGHADRVLSVAVCADERTVISGGKDASVRVWDLTAESCCTPKTGEINQISGVAVSAYGAIALTGHGDHTVSVWDLSTLQKMISLKEHLYGVTSVALSPDGHTGIAGSLMAGVSVWDLPSGQFRAVLGERLPEVYCVAVSSDGQTVLSGGRDKMIRIWSLRNGRCRRVLKGHTDAVSWVAVASDGRCVISESYDATVRVWDLATGRCQAVLAADSDAAQRARVSAYRARDAIAQIQGVRSLVIRSTNTGACIAEFPGCFNHADCSTDGRRVVAADARGQVYFLRVCSNDLDRNADKPVGSGPS